MGPGFVLVEGGKIVSVTSARPSQLPGNALELRAAVVTPGFIDARTTVGLSGLHPDDDDRDETSGPNQAHLRAIDAYDPDDPMVAHALRRGVTTVQTGPGDANSIGGQAGIFKLAGATVAEAVVRFPSALVFSLDETAKLTYGTARRYPSTRMANVGIIRQALLEAQEYAAKAASDNPPTRDLKKEALAMALAGEIQTVASAERADEMATALRLWEEFHLDLQITGATAAQVMGDRLEEAGLPILLGPSGDAALESDSGDELLKRPADLKDRGIPFALVTGNDEDAPRISLQEMAVSAIRGGLTLEEALRAITITPARILGLGESLGSIEAGKDADLVLFDGEPLAPASHVLAVISQGEVVYQRGR
jgi:imidazolonepropionase-like amidohydrolase